MKVRKLNNKIKNHGKGWLLVLPATILLIGVGLIPVMTIVNYSLFDIFLLDQRYWIGFESYINIMQSGRFWASLMRSLLFSLIILTIQLPLGILIALSIPRRGIWVSICLLSMAVPLLVPWNVIPIIWLNYIHVDNGYLGRFFIELGIDFDYKFNAIHTWIAIVLMDVWHWTSLVVLLCYSNLTTVPVSYYQACKIDRANRWQVFRYVELPYMKASITMLVLLRFLDSFMIYTEAFGINSGGPNNATMFLAMDLGEIIKTYDYGPSSARSVVYILIILTAVYGIKTALTGPSNSDHVERAKP